MHNLPMKIIKLKGSRIRTDVKIANIAKINSSVITRYLKLF